METIDKSREGMVLRIERSSIHDGSGFRTVVFLKGCPLRCQWCSTPESQSFAAEQAGDTVYGRPMTVGEVMRELRKDSLFFFMSGGGMTLSGGEILSQPEFALALLRNSRREGIGTAIETSFFGPWEKAAALLAHADTAFVDLKLMDDDLHRQYCGVSNALILSNLRATNEAEGKFRLVVRTPVIPGVNDAPEELHRIGTFCQTLTRLDYIQLLPYHRLGTNTYQKLGRPYLLADTPTPTEEQMEACRSILRTYRLNVR